MRAREQWEAANGEVTFGAKGAIRRRALGISRCSEGHMSLG